jgi:hypothetical protein
VGTAGHSIALGGTATPTNFSWTAGTLTGGTSGTNTGTDFAIDGVLADDATNLASAITRNGGTVGVSATSSGAVVTVTATTAGSAGNSITLAEALSNFSWAGSTLTGGSGGTDYLFLSTYTSTESGCSTATNNGCIMSFNVTTPSSFTGSLAPAGVDNLAAPFASGAGASPTGGIIIDNGIASGVEAGASQAYFLTQYTGATSSPCTGICAIQVSQVP